MQRESEEQEVVSRAYRRGWLDGMEDTLKQLDRILGVSGSANEAVVQIELMIVNARAQGR